MKRSQKLHNFLACLLFNETECLVFIPDLVSFIIEKKVNDYNYTN